MGTILLFIIGIFVILAVVAFGVRFTFGLSSDEETEAESDEEEYNKVDVDERDSS